MQGNSGGFTGGGGGAGVCASPINLPREGAEGMQGGRGANFFQVLKKILFVRKGFLAMASR